MNNKKNYRLHYVNYYLADYKRVGLIDWPYKPFVMPDHMTEEEGFKTLSYLTDFIEKRDDIDECSFTSVAYLDIILEKYGFKRVNETDENRITDLFTVNGRFSLFEKSEFYKKYFNWYKDRISKEEIEKIYNKLGMEFNDIVWFDSKDKTKVLKK